MAPATLHRWISCQTLVILVSSSYFSSIKLCYTLQIYLSDYIKSAMGKLICQNAESPCHLAGFSNVLPWRTKEVNSEILFAAYLLKLSKGMVSSVSLKSQGKLYSEIKCNNCPKGTSIQYLKCLINSEKYLFSLILIKSESHWKLNILTKGNPTHIFLSYFFLMSYDKWLLCPASWEWKK